MEAGQVEAARAFIEQQRAVLEMKHYQIALMIAARRADEAMVAMLLPTGVDSDSALNVALHEVRDPPTSLLVQLAVALDVTRADPTLIEDTLITAIKDGRVALVSTLLDKGAKPSVRNSHRQTALYLEIRLIAFDITFPVHRTKKE